MTDIHLFPALTRPDLEEFWDGSTVVTVGNGAGDPIHGALFEAFPNFPSILAAWNAMPSRGMILVWPGTYNNCITGFAPNNTDLKNGVIRGMGAHPADVNWHSIGQSYGSNVTLRTLRTKVLFENLRMSNGAAWELTLQTYRRDCHVISSKVHFNHSGSSHAINSRSESDAWVYPDATLTHPMEFLHCTIRRGYNHFSRVHYGSVKLWKTEFDQGITSHQCRGSLFEPDFVTTPTPGYGIGYGDFIVQFTDHAAGLFVYAGTVHRNLGTAPVRVALMRPGSKQIIAWTRPDALGGWRISIPWYAMLESEHFVLYLSDGCRPQIEGPYPPTQILEPSE